MGTTLSYRGRDRLDFAAVRGVFDRCRKIPGFNAWDPEERLHAYFTRDTLDAGILPAGGARIEGVDVKGKLGRGAPFEVFREIVTTRAATVSAVGRLVLQVALRERESHPTKGTDVASIVLSPGPVQFWYTAGGSKVALDLAYREAFMRSLAESSLLPLEVYTADDGFHLAHSRGGELKITRGGVDGENPSGFQVSVDGVSPLEMVDFLEEFLATHARRSFDYKWLAWPNYDDRLRPVPEGPHVLHAVVDAALPAERYEIHVVFRLPELGGLEDLRAMCGPKDQVFVTLGYFEWSSGDMIGSAPVVVDVVTSAEGYRITVDSRVPLDVEEFAGMLGLGLDDTPEG